MIESEIVFAFVTKSRRGTCVKSRFENLLAVNTSSSMAAMPEFGFISLKG